MMSVSQRNRFKSRRLERYHFLVCSEKRTQAFKGLCWPTYDIDSNRYSNLVFPVPPPLSHKTSQKRSFIRTIHFLHLKIYVSRSLIIHEEKTKEISTVKEV